MGQEYSDQVNLISWAIARIDCGDNLETFASYVLTKDEHKSGDESKRQFPKRDEKPHVWDVLDTLQRESLLAIEKSRQMQVTWLVALYVLWVAKYRQNRLIFWQSKKEEDAANVVFNQEWSAARISFMESNLPPELRSECSTSYGKIRFKDTESLVWAIPEGGDQIRSYTASLIISDEAAFQPEFENAWKAARASVGGGGQFVCLSSARSGSYMRQLIKRA